jgi:tellurite resistance protein TerC
MYVFGAMVLLAGVKMFRHGPEDVHPERNPVLKFAAKHLRVTKSFVEDKFFVRSEGVLMATPLFLVLVAVEATDVVFAIDSVPAIFAITRDPFIVFTSNVFAILGLRALYFLLAGVMGMFRYLSEGLALVLCFIGAKMLLTDVYHIPIGISLGVVLGILAIAVVASIIAVRKERLSRPEGADEDEAVVEAAEGEGAACSTLIE